MDGYERWYETYPAHWAQELIPYGKMMEWVAAGRLPQMYRIFKRVRYEDYEAGRYEEFSMGGLWLLQIELMMSRGVYVHAKRRKLKKGEAPRGSYPRPDAWLEDVMRELEK